MPKIKNWSKLGEYSWVHDEYRAFVGIKKVTDAGFVRNMEWERRRGQYFVSVQVYDEDKILGYYDSVDKARSVAVEWMRNHPRAG